MCGHNFSCLKSSSEKSKEAETTLVTYSSKSSGILAVFTQSGKTALLMSKVRPRVPILALSPEERTLALVNLYWGVQPMHIPYVDSLEKMVKKVDDALLKLTQITNGQQIVLISGFPVGSMHLPNLALLHAVGEEV